MVSIFTQATGMAALGVATFSAAELLALALFCPLGEVLQAMEAAATARLAMSVSFLIVCVLC